MKSPPQQIKQILIRDSNKIGQNRIRCILRYLPTIIFYYTDIEWPHPLNVIYYDFMWYASVLYVFTSMV